MGLFLNITRQPSLINIITGNQLTRQQRLKTPDDFKKVYQSKQWGGSEHHTFNVLAHEAGNDSLPRLGVSVSKKVSKNAVVRNHIKRQIKEFYRCRKKTLIASDLVITAKPSCAKANNDERYESLTLLWNKILKWQRWYSANHPHKKD